jgi:hypothetical protein
VHVFPNWLELPSVIIGAEAVVWFE